MNRVQSGKHTRLSPLQTTFEQAQLKKLLINQFSLVPTAQMFDIRRHNRMWTPRTETTRIFGAIASITRPNTTTSSLTLQLKRIKIETQTRRNWLLPGSEWKPRPARPLVKIFVTVAVSLRPSDDFTHDMGEHAVEVS